MALVSGGRSTLNPDAPLFIPAALRQVEDFSPEWWELVKTSTWFRDYWLSQHQEEDNFGNYENGLDGNDITDLLPDTFDLGAGEDFSIMEGQFEDFIQSSDGYESSFVSLKGMPGSGLRGDDNSTQKSLSLFKSSKPKASLEVAKYPEKAAHYVSPKCSPRRIQQPR